MTNLIVFIVTFIASWILMGLFVNWSVAKDRFDVPNERSSHETPTPVGGGVVFVVLTLGVWLIASAFSPQYRFQIVALCLSAAAVAFISWIDDVRPVSPLIRFAVHIFAASMVVLTFGAPDSIGYGPMGTFAIHPLLAFVLSVLWLVWMTNAFNFMDGIDGISGGQAAVCCIGWALLLTFFGIPAFATGVLVLLAGVLGFLVYNWPPAKVFMGDVGSAFLGFFLSSFPFAASFLEGKHEAVYFLSAMAFLWPFAFDSLYTFFRRLISGEKVWKAHRKHIYQSIIRNGYSHRFTTLVYTGISIFVTAAALFETFYGVAYATPIVLVVSGAVLIVLERALGQFD